MRPRPRGLADHALARVQAFSSAAQGWVPGPFDDPPAGFETDDETGPDADRAGGGDAPDAAVGAARESPVRARRGLVLAAVVALALAAGVIGWSRPRAVGPVMPTVLTRGTPVPGATPDPTAATGVGSPPVTPQAVVVVDVEGRVRRPGVVRLPAGSRVLDALRAAGGARPGTSTVSLNLARVLVDGEQVVVGAPAPVAGATGAAAPPASGPLDLNAATLADLDLLPGIGPVLAQRILDWRAEHRRFTSVDELREVRGIGDATFADVAPLVRV